MMTQSTVKKPTSKPSVAVSDLKHWYYCPRVVYWRRVFKAAWVTGRVADLGKERHNLSWIVRLDRFRGCEVERDVCLRSEKLGLFGCLDALIKCGKEMHPLDLKRGWYEEGHDVQLGAYALLVEETYNTTVRTGFLYYPGKKLEEVEIDERLRKTVMRTIKKVQEMLESGRMPQPTRESWKCRVCDHLSYCRGI